MLCCQAYCNFQLHGLQSLNTDGEHQADGSHACTLLSMLSCPPNSQPCDLQDTYSLSSLDNNNPCARSHRLLVDSCPASEKSTHEDKATHTLLLCGQRHGMCSHAVCLSLWTTLKSSLCLTPISNSGQRNLSGPFSHVQHKKRPQVLPSQVSSDCFHCKSYLTWMKQALHPGKSLQMRLEMIG